MNFEPDIELYTEGDFEVVYEALLEKIGEKGMVKFTKKLTYYRSLTVETLLRTGQLDFINGSNPRLYELKIESMQIPVRFICSLEGRVLILLDVFFASGSRGEAERHLPLASRRLSKWRTSNA